MTGGRIDLNADLGESWPQWESGSDPALLDVVTSANVCCGAYAGDENLMTVTCEAAVARGVAIGAQVGYPDRDNFGRVRTEMPAADLTRVVADQIQLLGDIAAVHGARVTFVKPHGALYNRIADDPVQAGAVVDALLALSRPLPLVGLPGSTSLSMASSAGVPVITEGFADRGYTPAGRLIPRDQPGAVLTEAADVADRATALLDRVDTICIHSDTPGAPDLARAVRAALEAAGAELRSVAP